MNNGLAHEGSLADRIYSEEFLGALPKDEYDPLQSRETDYFWGSIEPYFAPIVFEDVEYLRDLDSRAGTGDECLRLEPYSNEQSEEKVGKKRRKKDVNSDMELFAKMNSFPLTHRLVASYLDEGQGANALSVGRIKGTIPEDTPWIGIGEDDALRRYQHILEERVAIELREVGLIDAQEDCELVTMMRNKQWELRDVKLGNSVRRNRLFTHVMNRQLKMQTDTRERKQLQDATEISYLDRMSRSSRFNKRTRAKFNKLKNQMFPDRRAIHRSSGNKSNNRTVAGKATGVAERRRKGGRFLSKGKASRKTRVIKEEVELSPEKPEEPEVEDDVANSSAPKDDSPKEANDKATGSSKAASVSQTVAEIVKDAGGEAAKDHIIAEFIRRRNIPNDEGAISRARGNIESALLFSMSPYCFRKNAAGDRFELKVAGRST
eukprot:Plantae.Rhodophyta-Hildenbrandia_rubra.ctg21086.p1 GENE.Plantae.Rhodophyta-Hildenbrandia_rubra.ctg21086~~Plantae.Rhodophyta-Hildenbrandia_rubra.ctg21086.p1  ORF type:complete len:434 (-),score=80.40 Plantae.Rhodophyta-Hildenbrandia_rubra.ctg21086:260-1561(-)